jgi:hypothetical protein
MNAFERLLQDDLHHLIDRMAATTPAGCLAGAGEAWSDRLAESEARISAARARLLDDYAEWRDALAGCGDLCELAGLYQEPVAALERRAA